MKLSGYYKELGNDVELKLDYEDLQLYDKVFISSVFWRWLIITAEEKLLENGYEGIKYLTDFSYDDALIGVTHDNRAVYDYEKMVEWLISTEGFTEEEAIEWIDYNTLRAIGYFGEDAPIIMYPIEE